MRDGGVTAGSDDMLCDYFRPHQSLKGLTPARRIGLADQRWTLAELLDILDSN